MMSNEWEKVYFSETFSVQNVQMFAAFDLGECLKVNEIFLWPGKSVLLRMFMKVIGFDVWIFTGMLIFTLNKLVCLCSLKMV